MKLKSMKKLITALVMATALLVAGTISASACTALFAGGDLTVEGAPIVARSEDYVNSMNKLYIINEAGKYKAGEKFVGCPAYGGFEWTWSHDSYRFTSFTADNVYNGVCPECGEGSPESPVTHDSYTESGANEKGVVVSATETLYGNGKCNAADVDPMRTTKVDGKVGIEETDIPTVILAEAATAREGIELLCDIYDEYGCYYASGLFIADQEEIWYIENCSGTQYVAVKLPSDILFLEPNMAVIGEIDLDDTENVIASDRLIEVAKQANSFVGNEEENIINFRASYSRISMDARLVNGLNFINSSYNYTADQLSADNSLFTISNVKNGEIVKPYTNIKADRVLSADDAVNYYKVDAIGRVRNVDTAFFQIFSDRPVETAIVEWTAMDHGGYNVFIPQYPALLDELYEGYGVGTDVIAYHDEKPNTDLTYSSSRWVSTENGWVQQTSWITYPEGWENSFFWCYDVLSNYMEYTDNSQADYVKAQFKALQEQFYEEFAALDVSNPETARANATASAKSMSERAHALALEMIDYVRDAHVPADYQEFLGKLDYEQAMVNAQALVEGIGVRLTGTKAEIAGLDYIEEQYAKLGYEIERQDFTVSTRTSGDIYIGDMVLAAGTPAKPGKNDTVVYFTGFRPASGTSLYLADPAKASELGDLTGKIVFFPGNFRVASGKPVSQATYDAVKILEEKNAAGIVMMMDATTESTERYQIRVSTPNFKNVGMFVDTPLLVINAMDAEKMMAYFAENKDVPVTMDVRDHVDSQNLIVTKYAAEPTDLTLYVTSHIDSVLPSPGANDNASGVVGILAMAEAFQYVETNYNIKFITFGAEEVGLQGARYFAKNMTPEEIDNAIGNYNLDMVATSQENCVFIFMNSSTNPSAPVNDASLETHVTRMSRAASETLGFDQYYYRTCYDKTTDHYALHEVGIPAVEFDWRANEQGTSFEAYYHTRYDDFQHNFSKDKLQTQVDIISLAVYNDATADYAAVTGEGVYRTYHDTLADAVASIADGETVKLLQDNSETITFVDEFKSFTLDKNGCEFTGSVKATGKYDYVVEFENGTYTVTLHGSVTPITPVDPTPVVPPVVEPEKPVFSDVDVNAWYNNAVQNALDKGLMAGTSSTTFAPNAKLTRAMVVQILYSMEGKPAVSGAADFSDVAANDWFAAAVKWASDNKIVAGMGDGTFAPNANVTREQLAVILMGYAKAEGKNVSAAADLAAYADASSVSTWAEAGMKWAVGSGIISGKTATTLDAQGTATRAEVAQMILKFEAI